MIVKGVCPECKKEFYMSVVVECLEKRIFDSEEEAHKYILNNVVVKIPTEHGLDIKQPIKQNEN